MLSREARNLLEDLSAVVIEIHPERPFDLAVWADENGQVNWREVTQGVNVAHWRSVTMLFRMATRRDYTRLDYATPEEVRGAFTLLEEASTERPQAFLTPQLRGTIITLTVDVDGLVRRIP